MENILWRIGTFYVEHEFMIIYILMFICFLILFVINQKIMKRLKEKNILLRKSYETNKRFWANNIESEKKHEETKITLDEARKNSKDKNLVISKQKKRIIELELACLFAEDTKHWKDLAKNLAMFRKMTIKQLENEKQSWKGSKVIKTKKSKKDLQKSKV